MADFFFSQSYSISELLAPDRRYRVPVYQRSYSWTSKEASRLLDDVVEARNTAKDGHGLGSPFFLGAMVLIGQEGRSDTGLRTFDVVDGQQRLITISLLLAVMRDIIAPRDPDTAEAIDALICVEADGVRTGRVEMEHPNRDFYESLVCVRGATLGDIDLSDLDEVSERLVENLTHFRSELAPQNGTDSEDRAADCLETLDFLLARAGVVCIETDDLESAVQIFIRLNELGLELTRGSIIKAKLLGMVDSDDQRHLGNMWRKWNEDLQPSGVDELFSHVRTVHGRTREAIVPAIIRLCEDSGGSRIFLETMVAPLAKAFHQVRLAWEQKGDFHPEHGALLERLSWLANWDWVAPVLYWLHRHDDNPDRTQSFLRALDRLAYGMMILGVGRDRRVARYLAVTNAIKAQDMDQVHDALALDWREQARIGYNVQRELHRRHHKNCRMVLLRIEDKISGGLPKSLLDDLTVEHILPHRVSPTSTWNVWYPNPEERVRRIEQLGNLTLVSHKENKLARNEDFAIKKDIFFPGNARHPFALTDMLRHKETWRAEDIDLRTSQLMAIVSEIWDLRLS